ncbi:MAG: TIGR03905 family TSCPD domain-containing protein [Bacilli bacterium]|nr:TIGR03905 family TSCPD domain-containing protein [Bacilli bacterium]
MEYKYKTKGTCSVEISFDINDNVITNISFLGGCNGNLKAISKLLDGQTVEYIEEKLKGNQCGMRGTSCADQLAIAVRKAYDEEKGKI